jgi:hypothetical protein
MSVPDPNADRLSNTRSQRVIGANRGDKEAGAVSRDGMKWKSHPFLTIGVTEKCDDIITLWELFEALLVR